MSSLTILGSLTLALTGYSIYEASAHRRNLMKIKNRIHVSGTRGKSSVTRLLAAGLKESGIKTCAKTTGTLPRMIFPDGREVPVFRPSGSNILEQKRVISAAARMGVDAVVIECMALQPELHWISERMLVKATHGVITNIRPDHLDVMGPGTADVARALAGMIPVKGRLFTAEREYLDILEYACKDRGSELINVGEDEINSLSEAEMEDFPYFEHKENVALCLKIFESFGIGRRDALRNMYKVKPDPGVLSEHELDFFGRKINFVNAFAANDPQSTESIWRTMCEKYSGRERKIAVLNLREDRAARTCQLARETEFWKEADRIVLIGAGSYLFSRLASKSEYPMNRFVYSESERIEDIFEQIIEVCGKSALVIGMGNIGGPGLPLVRYFKNRETIN